MIGHDPPLLFRRWRAAVAVGRSVQAVSAAETETSAAIAAVERAAEALDADVAAIVCAGELVAAMGYPDGTAPPTSRRATACCGSVSATTASPVRTSPRGSGLVGLRDRVEALGGRIALQSKPGVGTSLSIELPLDDDGR